MGMAPRGVRVTPTVIDALVVELGLDPKRFTQGQKDAIEAFKKTREAVEQRGKEIEASSQRSAQFFSRLRAEAVGLLAAFVGARGIKDFVANLVTGDAALGRSSRAIGVSADELAKWGNVARLAGADAGEMVAAFKNLQNEVQTNLREPGATQIRVNYAALSAEGGHLVTVNMTLIDQLKAIAANFAEIEKKTPGGAGYWSRKLGLEGALPALIRGTEFMERQRVLVEQLGHATKEDTDRAEELLNKWQQISILLDNIGRKAFGKAVDNELNFWKENLELVDKHGWKGLLGKKDAEGLAKGGWEYFFFGSSKAGTAAPGASLGPIQGVSPEAMAAWRASTPLPAGVIPPPIGARGAVSNVDRRSSESSTTTTTMHVNGPVTINTQVTDAEGLKNALLAEGQRRLRASSANYGQF